MKKIVPYFILTATAFSVFFSWRNTFLFRNSDMKNYQQYIASAEKYESKEIYIDAVAEYEKAFEINKDDYNLAMKIADIYKKLDDNSGYIKACQKAISADKTKAEPYFIIAENYQNDGDYDKEYDILNQALENTGDENKEKIMENIRYIKGLYNLSSSGYVKINQFHFNDDLSVGYASVVEDGKYGLVDNNNNVIAECIYDDIGILNDDVIPVKSNGEYYYINSDGYRKLVPDEKADYLGSFSEGYAPASFDGVYGYIDKDMKLFNHEYSYCGAFSNGIAAVKKDNKWAVIDSSLENITDWIFDDIIVDDYGYCGNYGTFWAKKDGKYYLYDNKGKILSDGYDEACQFASYNEPAAVKQNGKWGFINTDGSVFIEPEYEKAKSFCIGYAPVYVDGMWGCIDMDNIMVISPEFEDIQPFNDKGFAIAQMDSSYKYLNVNIY